MTSPYWCPPSRLCLYVLWLVSWIRPHIVYWVLKYCILINTSCFSVYCCCYHYYYDNDDNTDHYYHYCCYCYCFIIVIIIIIIIIIIFIIIIIIIIIIVIMIIIIIINSSSIAIVIFFYHFFSHFFYSFFSYHSLNYQENTPIRTAYFFTENLILSIQKLLTQSSIKPNMSPNSRKNL